MRLHTSGSRFKRSLPLLLLVLALLGVWGFRRYQFAQLHQPIEPGDVLRLKPFGHLDLAGPIQAEQVIAWFNAGTDPRPSPENAGHTSTEGGIIIQLRSGDGVGLWPWDGGLLVAQQGKYYYLRQPDLGKLLQKLDGRI